MNHTPRSLRWLHWPVVAVLVAFGQWARAASDEEAWRWEAELQEFEQADRTHPPPPEATLFIGSSSIRKWGTLAQDFPERTVINRGFGGSHMSDMVLAVDRIVLPYRPQRIVVYAGDNDLASEKSPRTVEKDFRAFCARVQAELPDTRIAFIAIKPSLKRRHLLRQMAEANARIGRLCVSRPELDYVDVFWPMLGADGEPREELFVEDGLHLNAQGYALWTAIVRRHLAE